MLFLPDAAQNEVVVSFERWLAEMLGCFIVELIIGIMKPLL